MTQNAVSEKVPCAIQADSVNESQCNELQEAFPVERCFGCASPWRLCTKCHEEIVAFPEIPFCSACLKFQLEEEAAQGTVDGARKCKQCQQRTIRFQDYSLCLRCTVEQFSPESRAVQAESDPPSPARKKRKRRSTAQTETGPGSELYRRAVAIAVSDGSVTNKKLMQKLQIQHGAAKRILDAMQAEGVIGPPRGPRPRETLVDSVPPPAQLPARTKPSSNGVLTVSSLSLDGLLNGKSEDAQTNRKLVQLGLRMLRDRIDQIGVAFTADEPPSSES